jgi:hypothetical protein
VRASILLLNELLLNELLLYGVQAFRQCFDFYMSVRSSAPTAAAGAFTVPTLDVSNREISRSVSLTGS